MTTRSSTQRRSDWKYESAPYLVIVIVGTGFGDLEAARNLAKKNVRVTVIDIRNHHLFQRCRLTWRPVGYRVKN